MSKPQLHILFTINCEPPAKKAKQTAPDSWESSARSIEGFCNRVLNAGYAATLFLSPRVADEHAPMLEEFAQRGAELGLYLHPEHLGDHRFTAPLGTYSEQEQHELVLYALNWFQDALSARPQSFRPADFSASDETFRVLYELGFRQGSVSNPGWHAPRLAARWSEAPESARYVDPANRLQPGSLPFLEVPVTSDPTSGTLAGNAADLRIESGTFERWHQPIISRRLAQMDEQGDAFRTLCVFTHNRFAYSDEVPHSTTLDTLIDYVDSLSQTYDIVPLTVAGAHTAWLRQN